MNQDKLTEILNKFKREILDIYNRMVLGWDKLIEKTEKGDITECSLKNGEIYNQARSAILQWFKEEVVPKENSYAKGLADKILSITWNKKDREELKRCEKDRNIGYNQALKDILERLGGEK
jgi:hypothetical protein